jgi:hypothetical protein
MRKFATYQYELNQRLLKTIGNGLLKQIVINEILFSIPIHFVQDSIGDLSINSLYNALAL